jgi:ABC-type dipeptide/oligopeptide/nickel transport system permease component
VLIFVARRLLLAVPVLLGVVFVVMLTVELIPGDAVALMLGEHATPEAVAKLRDFLGLDKPLLVRYVGYVGRVARGDLGRSIQQNRPVIDELADAWPATLELTVAALAIAAAAGIAAGVVSAVWPNSLFDAVARVGSLFGLSMPVFWTGLVLIVVFALWLPWLPVGGMGSPSISCSRGDPGPALARHGGAHDALQRARSAARGLRAHGPRQGRGGAAGGGQARAPQRGHSHPDLARAPGGPAHGRGRAHGDRLSWPGLGRLMVKAIFARDYVLLQGAVLIFALAFVLINLAVDLAYGALDPASRARASRWHAAAREPLATHSPRIPGSAFAAIASPSSGWWW